MKYPVFQLFNKRWKVKNKRAITRMVANDFPLLGGGDNAFLRQTEKKELWVEAEADKSLNAGLSPIKNLIGLYLLKKEVWICKMILARKLRRNGKNYYSGLRVVELTLPY